MGRAPGGHESEHDGCACTKNVWILQARAKDKQRGVAPVEECQGRDLRDLLSRKQGAARVAASPAEAGVSENTTNSREPDSDS